MSGRGGGGGGGGGASARKRKTGGGPATALTPHPRRPFRDPRVNLDMELVRVLGMNAVRAGGIASTQVGHTGDVNVAYPAGAVVVVFSVKRNKQVMHLRAPASPGRFGGDHDGSIGHGGGSIRPAVSASWSVAKLPDGARGTDGLGGINGHVVTGHGGGHGAPSSGPWGGGHASKPFACVAYSQPSGRFIAAGEVGHRPAVVVWSAETGEAMAHLCGEASPSSFAARRLVH